MVLGSNTFLHSFSDCAESRLPKKGLEAARIEPINFGPPRIKRLSAELIIKLIIILVDDEDCAIVKSDICLTEPTRSQNGGQQGTIVLLPHHNNHADKRFEHLKHLKTAMCWCCAIVKSTLKVLVCVLRFWWASYSTTLNYYTQFLLLVIPRSFNQISLLCQVVNLVRVSFFQNCMKMFEIRLALKSKDVLTVHTVSSTVGSTPFDRHI